MKKFVVAIVAAYTISTTIHAQVSVLTAQSDNGRSSANLFESTLSTSNVNVNQFGKLFARAVDGYIYAQPLYVPSVNIPGKGIHNVVYVATMNDTVFAFDADDRDATTPLWQTSLGTAVPATSSYFPFDETGSMAPTNGIISTPVIDLSARTLYAVALVLQAGLPTFQIHALNIITGAERPGSPVALQATLPGSGPDSQHGMIAFSAAHQDQRTGLLLVNGKIYFGFASNGNDIDPYHGWIFGYDASTLQQIAVVNLTPGGKGGIWQSGGGLSADAAGLIYACTGNGVWDGTLNFGESCVKLDPSQRLSVVDYFTPYNHALLDAHDYDLGSGRVLFIPGTSYAVTGGKQGRVYILDRNNLGHLSVGDVDVIQQIPVGGGIYAGLAYWNNPASPTLYIWGSNDYLRAYRFTKGRFGTSPASMSTMAANQGSALTISANGGASRSGIVWATTPSSIPAFSAVPGTLHAFDASDVSKELWNSDQDPGRDTLGNFARFAAPTVANGKVYLATFSNQLLVYGILPSTSLTVSPASVILGASQAYQFDSNTPASWTIAPALGSISASGLFTAPSTVSTQRTVTVTATHGSQTATAKVTLTPVVVHLNPARVGVFASQTQQFTAAVTGSSNTMVTWTIEPAAMGSISTAGLYTAPSAIGRTPTVTVTATSAADNKKSAPASVTLNPSVAPGISQQPKSVPVFVGEAANFIVAGTAIGLTYQWQSALPGATNFSAISGATSRSYVTPAAPQAANGTQLRCIVTNTQGSTISKSATLTVLPLGATFLTSEALGSLRNNFTGWLGMSVTVGANPLVVTSLGRMVAPGTSGTHTLKIVDADTGSDVLGASALINVVGAATGAFVYSGLAAPVTLNADTTYYILSNEIQGGDDWYDNNTMAYSTADATISGSVFGATFPFKFVPGSAVPGPSLPFWPSEPLSGGQVYGPVDFIYTQK